MFMESSLFWSQFGGYTDLNFTRSIILLKVENNNYWQLHHLVSSFSNKGWHARKYMDWTMTVSGFSWIQAKKDDPGVSIVQIIWRSLLHKSLQHYATSSDSLISDTVDEWRRIVDHVPFYTVFCFVPSMPDDYLTFVSLHHFIFCRVPNWTLILLYLKYDG